MDNKYTSPSGIGGMITTLVGVLVATGILTPEQGTIIGLHAVPVIGGVIALLGAFSVWHTPSDAKSILSSTPAPKPTPIKSLTPDTSKRDPFNPA